MYVVYVDVVNAVLNKLALQMVFKVKIAKY